MSTWTASLYDLNGQRVYDASMSCELLDMIIWQGRYFIFGDQTSDNRVRFIEIKYFAVLA